MFFFYVADICQQGLSLDGGWAAEEEEASSPKLLWEQPWPSVCWEGLPINSPVERNSGSISLNSLGLVAQSCESSEGTVQMMLLHTSTTTAPGL